MAVPIFDVVIAGAGPSGCAAAIRLRQLDLSVCLIDTVAGSALKVGESLPGASLRLLRRLGISNLSDLLDVVDYSACTANVSAWGTEYWTYNDAIRNPETGGWHILRHKFDAALQNLAQKQGVVFYKGKIGKITPNTIENEMYGNYTIGFKTKAPHLPRVLHTKWVVDATGRATAVLKQFRIPRQKFQTQLAAVAWLKPNVRVDTAHTTRIKSVRNGWWYTARLPDHSRVIAFYGLPDVIKQMVKVPNEFISAINLSAILKHTVNTEFLIAEVKACNAETALSKQVIGQSWLAVGDAALSLDPISSQGLFFGLYSGIRGAEAISNCLSNNFQEERERVKRDYQQKIERVFTANQNSRKYFYTRELRYQSEPYWKQYIKNRAGVEVVQI